MAKRADIVSNMKQILEGITELKIVRTSQTDITKENSFPIAWVLLEDETFPSESLQKNFRQMNMIVRICVKQNIGDDVLNPLLDKIIGVLETNYTINGTVINSNILRLETDYGLLYPYAVVDFIMELLTK